MRLLAAAFCVWECFTGRSIKTHGNYAKCHHLEAAGSRDTDEEGHLRQHCQGGPRRPVESEGGLEDDYYRRSRVTFLSVVYQGAAARRPSGDSEVSRA